MGGVESELDVLRGGLRHLGEGLAGDRADVLHVLALTGATQWPPMKFSYGASPRPGCPGCPGATNSVRAGATSVVEGSVVRVIVASISKLVEPGLLETRESFNSPYVTLGSRRRAEIGSKVPSSTGASLTVPAEYRLTSCECLALCLDQPVIVDVACACVRRLQPATRHSAIEEVTAMPETMSSWVVDVPGPIDENLSGALTTIPDPAHGQMRVGSCLWRLSDRSPSRRGGPGRPKRNRVIPGHEIVGVVDLLGRRLFTLLRR